MSIPLAIFYYIYLVFVLIFLLYTFFNVYHLLRFAGPTPAVIVVTGFYILFSIALLMVSWQFIGAIDWQQSIQVIRLDL